MKKPIKTTGKKSDYTVHGGPMFFCDCDDIDTPQYVLDQEIRAHLAIPGESKKSTTEKKIEQLKGGRFIESLPTNTSDEKRGFNPHIPVLLGGIPSKQFTLSKAPDTSLFLFEVVYHYDYLSREKNLDVKQLDWIDSEDSNFRTFFWDEPTRENMLLLISFRRKSSGTIETYISSAIYEDSSILVQKNPSVITMQEDYSKGMSYNTSIYDVEGSSTKPTDILDENGESKIEVVETDLDQLPVVIIDPFEEKLVLRELFHDEETSKIKARIRVRPYRGYFTFEVIDADSHTRIIPLTKFEQGCLYKTGAEGFPKDPLLAIRNFEEDDSAEAMYQLAGIFATDEEVGDLELYEHFLKAAVNKNHTEAAAELAFSECVTNSYNFEMAKKCFGTSLYSGVGSFLCAYYLETHLGLDENNYKREIFKLYFDAALDGFEPALARLQCNCVDLYQHDTVLSVFLETDNKGLSRYCMGCMRFFGYSCNQYKIEGINLLSDAHSLGVLEATKVLYEIYKDDTEYKDDVKATALLECVVRQEVRPDLMVELSNRLLDGVGCETSEENDRKAFELSSRGAELGYSPAIHNLGWMCKFGRGCAVDYARAMELFFEAKCANSYFHIADMYENGMGACSSTDLAHKYLVLAAEMGSKKAKSKLADIDRKRNNAVEGQTALDAILGEVGFIRSKVESIEILNQSMNNNIISLSSAIKQLDNTVAIGKKELSEKMNGCTLSEEEQEKIRSAFISETAERIIEIIHQDVSAVETEEQELSGLFGDNWYRLDEYTRRSLISAKVFFTNSSNPTYENLDYSGIIVAATSALENELKLRFFTGYQNFVFSKLGPPSTGSWPEILIFTNRQGKQIKNANFTMGSLPYIFSCNEKDKMILNEYLSSIVTIKQEDNLCVFVQKRFGGKSFIDRCEAVRNTYRNAAAHTEPVNRAKAEACCKDIIGLYEASKKIGQVQGLLYDLVQLTENFK